jgi:hypothetical protein
MSKPTSPKRMQLWTQNSSRSRRRLSLGCRRSNRRCTPSRSGAHASIPRSNRCKRPSGGCDLKLRGATSSGIATPASTAPFLQPPVEDKPRCWGAHLPRAWSPTAPKLATATTIFTGEVVSVTPVPNSTTRSRVRGTTTIPRSLHFLILVISSIRLHTPTPGRVAKVKLPHIRWL